MKTTKMNYTTEPAKRITLETEHNMDVYKDVFLRLFNLAREYPKTIFAVENNSGWDIMITVPVSRCAFTTDWLSDYGKVTDVEDVLVFRAEIPEYDYHTYEDCVLVMSD